MSKTINITIVLSLAILIQACSGMAVTRKAVSSTGRDIDRQKVQQIVVNETTQDEIIKWFGAPTSTSQSGNYDFLTYKYCETSVSMWAGSQRDDCDTLTLTIERSISKVTDYTLEEGIKERTKF